MSDSFNGKCSRCRNDLDLPLLCRECNIWLCSKCWLPHDVEMMKRKGLLLCSCGEDHG